MTRQSPHESWLNVQPGFRHFASGPLPVLAVVAAWVVLPAIRGDAQFNSPTDPSAFPQTNFPQQPVPPSTPLNLPPLPPPGFAPFGAPTGPGQSAQQGVPAQLSSSSTNMTASAFSGLGTAEPRPVQAPSAMQMALSQEEELAAGQLICVVGEEYILAGDMVVFVEPILQENRKRFSPAQEKQVRAQLVRQVLKQYVEVKALYQEFFRDMTGNGAPGEIRETKQKVGKKANQIFYEKQVPELLKQYEATDIAGLEEKLRAKSVSLNLLRSQFVERVLASELERKHVPEEIDLKRAELLEYYNAHRSDWEKPARARWRQLTVRFDKFSSPQAARAMIEQMGNEVYLGGKPFEVVAKERSQGITASDGGKHDWTTFGSLKSDPLNKAVFTIPPNHLSQIIEDDVGYHIIEVLEREDAKVTTFEEAQPKIRKVLKERKQEEIRTAYRKSVIDKTIVWTRWPEDIPGSRSLTEVLGEEDLKR